MRYVLYLNLWGTLEKLRSASTSDTLFNTGDVLTCQQGFENTLSSVSLRYPTATILHATDSAHIVCPSIDELLLLARDVFQNLLAQRPPFVFWPLRGAIACDENAEARSGFLSSGERSEHFRSIALFGPAPIEAANLEKSAQKGFRLLLTTAAARDARTLPLRPCSTRGIEHMEACWSVGLDSEIRQALLGTMHALLERDGNYARQMASSIDDLLEWSQAEKSHSTRSK